VNNQQQDVFAFVSPIVDLFVIVLIFLLVACWHVVISSNQNTHNTQTGK
jgi:hypothetical protein